LFVSVGSDTLLSTNLGFSCQHPAPPGTSVESDDGLKEVLPPHKRDVANHYHEIHLVNRGFVDKNFLLFG
jgi:hypothetical protein